MLHSCNQSMYLWGRAEEHVSCGADSRVACDKIGGKLGGAGVGSRHLT